MLVCSLARPPVPETTVARLRSSDRLMARVPLFVTLPAIEPVVPPLPICSVPAEIVVPPDQVLAAARTVVPVPP